MFSTQLYNVKYIINGQSVKQYIYGKNQIQGMPKNKTKFNKTLNNYYNELDMNNITDDDGNIIGEYVGKWKEKDYNLFGTTKDQARKEKKAQILPMLQAKADMEKARHKKYNAYRKKQKIMNLISSNANELKTFITLTFEDNIQDVELANECFTNFIREYKRQTNFDLKYITVIEFQERGAVHYHMLCNIPVDFKPAETKSWVHNGKTITHRPKTQQQKDYEKEFRQNYWIWGFVNVDPLTVNNKDVDNTGAYISKYMTKLDDNRLDGRKQYFTSRGLNKPITIYLFSADPYNSQCTETTKYWNDQLYNKYTESDPIEDLFTLTECIERFNAEYESYYTGVVKFKEYNLKENNCLSNITQISNILSGLGVDVILRK